MLSTAFSGSANLGLLGYALVLSDGTAPSLNSGLAVERLSTGVYQITLPSGLGEPAASCLILAQPLGGIPITTTVEHVSDRVKIVSTNNRVSGKSNADFYVVIFRTTTKYDAVKAPSVSFVKVNSDGTAGLPNSGITTSRISLGQYRLTLPASLGQDANDNLIFVMALNPIIPLLWVVNSGTITATNKEIVFTNRIGINADVDFFAMILRIAEQG